MCDFFSIRQANINDVPEIVRIWREGAKEAFGQNPNNLSYEEFFQEKIRNQDDIFRTWVAVDNSDNIIGWQSLSPITNNPIARQLFAESSTYISYNNRHQGVGKLLIKYAVDFAENTTLHYVTAFVSRNNESVLKIAEEIGWVKVGSLPQSHKTPLQLQPYFIVYPVPRTNI